MALADLEICRTKKKMIGSSSKRMMKIVKRRTTKAAGFIGSNRLHQSERSEKGQSLSNTNDHHGKDANQSECGKMNSNRVTP